MSARDVALRAYIQYMYEVYCDVIMEYWMSFYGNPGQMVMVWTHMLPAAEAHCADIWEDWPDTNAPSIYTQDMLEAHEAAAQAFSITITGSADMALGPWENARYAAGF